jgi:hypothetical protein
MPHLTDAQKAAKMLKMSEREQESSPHVFPVIGVVDRQAMNGSRVWVVWAGRNKRIYSGVNLHKIKTVKSMKITIVPTLDEARTHARRISDTFNVTYVDILEPDSKGFMHPTTPDPAPVVKKPAEYNAQDVLRVVVERGHLDNMPELKRMARNVL